MTDEYAEVLEHKGFGIRIFYEQLIEPWMSPRDDDDGLLGVMFCDYRGYTLGDGDAPDPRGHAITCPDCGGEGEVEVPDTPILGLPDPLPTGTHPELCSACGGSGEIEESIVAYLKREHGARVILPLFVYEHSGITMSCGRRLDTGEDDFNRHGRYACDPGAWDTSSVGVIFDTTESRKRCGCEDWTDKRIEESLSEEVRWYAAYLENQVYGWEVVRYEQDEDEDAVLAIQRADDVIDVVGGYLVLDYKFDDLLMEAKAAVESQVLADAAEASEAFRWACADVVTKERAHG